ncbi:MAG: rhomboid family intramembrane serine protease [Clostridia bacterium]|nr:rhomboid family intramembrane serine protease [Clostridia bacterium]
MAVKRKRLVFNAPFVLGFAFVCVAVLLIGILTGGRSNELLFLVYRAPLDEPLTYIRFFTHVLGHANWGHLFNNMCYFLLLGPMLEERYGAKKLLLLVAFTALISGLVNFIAFPTTALCGASGVVFAFILLTSFTSFRSGGIPITVIIVAILYLGQQIYEGIFVSDDVSQLSHIIGGLVGAAAGYVWNRR